MKRITYFSTVYFSLMVLLFTGLTGCGTASEPADAQSANKSQPEKETYHTDGKESASGSHTGTDDGSRNEAEEKRENTQQLLQR